MWAVPAVMAASSVAAQLTGSAGQALLRFDRAGIAGGEAWRLLSGHLVHLGWPHLVMNIAGLGLVWLLFGACYRAAQWLLVLLISAAGVNAGLWFVDDGLMWYVGLSGVLHGVLVAGLVPGLRSRSAEAVLLGVALVAKLAYEQVVGPLPGSEQTAGGAVVVTAHVYGAIGGAAAAALLWRRVDTDTPI